MATKKKKVKITVSGGQIKKAVLKSVIPEFPRYRKDIAKLSTIIKVKNTERIINCVVGSQGTGKTVETKNVIKKYIKKYPKEKVLIVDVNDEYTEYPKIHIDGIEKIKKPSRICLHNLELDKRQEVLKEIGYKFRGGLLVVEDFNAIGFVTKYSDLMTFIACIINCRTRDIDVIITFSSLRNIFIKLMQNTTAFRIHKTFNDTDKTYEAYLYGNPLGKIPFDYARIESENNRYAHVYFDRINQSMVGVKNQESMLKACTEYYKPQINSLSKRLVDGKN